MLEKSEIGKDGLEYGLQTLVGPAALGFVHEEKLIVGGFLHLDQVGHFRDFVNAAERLAHLAAAVESGSHKSSSDIDVRKAIVRKADHPPSALGTGARSQ